jgi:hypothetical protein
VTASACFAVRHSPQRVSAFGQDLAGELHVVDLRGTVDRIDPA